jgi:thiol-disulfide isomerase/thioredoxin
MSDERKPSERRRPASRYSLFVGLAFLVLIVVATVNTIRTRDDGILGTSVAEHGEALAEFAVPELLGAATGDANIYQDDCATGSNPCPADQRHPAACEIDARGAIRVCDFFDRPLLISFWFTGGADCLPTQDLLDKVSRNYRGRVNFLSIDIRDDRDQARQIAREHGWQIPVGWDADGAVSNLYRVGVCPTVAFVYPGGLLSEAKLGTGELSEQQLTADIDRLLRESSRRAETDR